MGNIDVRRIQQVKYLSLPDIEGQSISPHNVGLEALSLSPTTPVLRDSPLTTTVSRACCAWSSLSFQFDCAYGGGARGGGRLVRGRLVGKVSLSEMVLC